MATIKELQSQLESLEKQLAETEAKAKATQSIIAKGWSAPAMESLEASLREITSLMSQLQSKKIDVVNNIALNEYNTTLKAIETTQARIAEKARAITANPPGTSGFNIRAEGELRKLENGLKSLEAKAKSTQYRNVYNPNAAPAEQFKVDADLEGRLGKMPPTSGIDRLNTAFKEMQKTTAIKPSVDMFTTMTSHVHALEASLTGLKDKALVINQLTPEQFAAGHIGGGAPGVAGDTPPSTPGGGKGLGGLDNDATKRRAAREALVAQLKAERAAWLEANQAMLAYARTQGIVDPEAAYKGTLLGGKTGAYDISTFKEKNIMGEVNTLKVRSDKQGNLSNQVPPKIQQSFAQGITKDIGDLLKWSVAIAAIYGPINAVSEAMKQLIENESKLADVSIALNSELVSTNQIFDDTYAAARRSGEGVSGIIDAFGAAYTAAGRIQDPLQRYAATLTLLDDSLVLSKLSTLDQAGAIDVLTAALYQTGDANATAAQKLDRGRGLIDQWIQVSKIASVSVETLATGVAVLGDSAETAGMTLEQMNGMIATLSEVSLTSGKETANVAKALIGNYQQEGAVKELNRLGIAVTDTSGKTREFLDVMKEVAALRSQKLLGDQDFSRLTLALGGGGIRRQKDVAAFIENYSRMEQIAGAQGNAEGASAEAMAKKLDTVQTATTNLTSAFTNLAQTMGTEGGLLDMFSLSIRGATGFVDALDLVAGAVGKVGPLLLGLGVGSLIMRGKAGGMSAMLMNNLGMSGNAAGLLTGGINPFDAALGTRMLGSKGFTGAVGRMSTLPSLAAIAAPAIQNLSQGDTTEAGANIAGGIMGALVGGPVGALVGSAIAEAFVRTTMTYDKQFADFFAGTVGAAKDEEANAAQPMSQEEMTKAAFKSLGLGSELAGGYLGKAGMLSEKVGSWMGMIAPEDMHKTEESWLYDQIKKSDPELYRQLAMSGAVTGENATTTNTKLTARQSALATPENQSQLTTMQFQKQNELRGQMISGDIKPSDYQNRMSELSAYTTKATRWLAAMEQDIGGVGSAFSTTEEAYSAFLEIMASGNQESINNINSQIATVVELQNIVDNWDPKEKTINMNINGVTKDWTKEGIQGVINAAPSEIATSASQAAQQARLQNLDLRSPVNGMGKPMAISDANLIAKEAYRLDKIQYANLKKDDFKALKESWDEVAVTVKDDMTAAGGEFVKTIKVGGENVSKENFNAAKQKLEEEGKLTKSGGVDWQVGQATKEQYLAAEAKAPAFTKMLESKGYKSDVTDTIVTTSDKQTIVSHGDQKVIQYLLQQILDTEKKQLQGIYNLPEGASIYVPFQAAMLGVESNTGGVEDLTDVNGDNKVAQANPVLNTEDLAMRGKGYNRDNSDIVALILEKEDKINSINEMRGRGYNRNNLDTSTAGGSTTPKDTGILEQLINVLRGLFPAAGQPITGGRYSPMDAMKNAKPLGAVGQQAATPPINNRLDLKLTSTTNLLVDGRVLASIVKPYLAADLMRTNESGGTVTRSFVI